MSASLKTAVQKHLLFVYPAEGTRHEYSTTLRKWREWDRDVTIERISRTLIRIFFERVQEQAVAHEGTNPGQTQTNPANSYEWFVMG